MISFINSTKENDEDMEQNAKDSAELNYLVDQLMKVITLSKTKHAELVEHGIAFQKLIIESGKSYILNEAKPKIHSVMSGAKFNTDPNLVRLAESICRGVALITPLKLKVVSTIRPSYVPFLAYVAYARASIEHHNAYVVVYDVRYRILTMGLRSSEETEDSCVFHIYAIPDTCIHN
jgi:hypothetical protein